MQKLSSVFKEFATSFVAGFRQPLEIIAVKNKKFETKRVFRSETLTQGKDIKTGENRYGSGFR